MARKSYPGRVHDYNIFKQENTAEKLSRQSSHYVDCGYDGAPNDYPECNIIMPVKRRKNHSALTRAEKRFNRKHSRIRILVEHVLSRMKNIKFWLRYTVIKSWITISDLEILLPSLTSGWQLLLFKINVPLMVFP